MEINTLFNLLNNPPGSVNQRELLISHLKDEAEKIRTSPNEATTIAYGIAGIMATAYAQSLTTNDPLDEILTIAGELEVNPNNSQILREELLRNIDELR